MKALSIRQPWAWLIVNGYKDVENRVWRTNFRGRFLIHAGSRPDQNLSEIRADVMRCFHIELPHTFDLGGIVGEAELVDCSRSVASAWFSGPCGFVLANARALPFKSCRGRLNFFHAEYP